jgi:hypothetical protein
LYTGDIRSEPWFVNSLRRNPLLIEYTSGLKPLDCIYLDTSFTDDIPFPTKAEGIKELLQKVASYPADTKFHLAAWTFGCVLMILTFYGINANNVIVTKKYGSLYPMLSSLP